MDRPASYKQQPLFDDPDGMRVLEERAAAVFANPIAHSNDPVTSHEAAEHITASGVRGEQARRVLDLVRRLPGKTAGELSEVSRADPDDGALRLDRVQVARRLTDLAAASLIRQGDPRACRAYGRRCVTWWPTAAQNE